MRYVYFVAAVLFMFCVNAMASEEAVGNGAVQAQAKTQSGQPVKAPKEIVVNDNGGRADDEEFGVGQESEMPESDTYDENTGLPNVVGSDTMGEIE